MQPTPYPDINELLKDLLTRMQAVLGEKLVGLYLYGSLVWGDFDMQASDIDLLAALASDVTTEEFEALHRLHDEFARDHQQWEGRIEVQYLSILGLETFMSKSTTMAAISPGDPFHTLQAGRDWLMNWYFVRENSVTLFGPDPKTIIAPITKQEFIDAVQAHAQGWREYISQADTRHGQAYAILTLCRAYYTAMHGEQVSKKQAALWAQKKLPEWAELIGNALKWRDDWRNKDVDHQKEFAQTAKFVNFVIDQIMVKEG